ncbi:MAG: BrnT family toxin [Anaerolineales bacterium]
MERYEVEEVFASRPKIRFMEKGDVPGEDMYIALGRTYAGRYLAVLFIYKADRQALVISARNMAKKERKIYARK